MAIEGLTLEEYYLEELAEVDNAAVETLGGASLEDAYTELAIDKLEAFEVLENARACYINQRNIKANGFAITDDLRHLDIIVTDFQKSQSLRTLGQQAVEKICNRARNFVESSLGALYHDLDIADPAYEMSKRIHDAADKLQTLRVVLVSNARIQRAEVKDTTIPGDIQASHHIWDVERMYHVDTSDKGREEVVVQLEKPIPCVMDEENDEYVTYLAVVPAQILADQYSKWGLRLLERNVRAYLQALGTVNKGILATLKEQPGRFLTYNNGLSAVAERVEVVDLDSGPALAAITDLQIVNGGQTTASLHRAHYQDGIDIRGAKVQMKLTVVRDPANIEEIVPKVSQYSNTQNPIKTQDLASNDEFHLNMEQRSRAIITPIHDTGAVIGHWFYERIRRQYMVEKMRQPAGKMRREWEKRNPKKRVFDKADLANATLVIDQVPHVVARGPAKAFAFFTEQVKDSQPIVDEDFFKEAVAKVILWKQMLSICRRFTGQGHLKNTAAYSLAWLMHQMNGRFNFSRIWNEQGLRPAIVEALEEVSDAVHHALTHPSEPQNYLGEWHKSDACWHEIRDLTIELDALGTEEYGPHSFAEDAELDPAGEPSNILEIHGQEVWFELMRWGIQTDNLPASAAAACSKVGMALRKGRDPNPKYVRMAVEALHNAEQKGFDPSSVQADG